MYQEWFKKYEKVKEQGRKTKCPLCGRKLGGNNVYIKRQ